MRSCHRWRRHTRQHRQATTRTTTRERQHGRVRPKKLVPIFKSWYYPMSSSQGTLNALKAIKCSKSLENWVPALEQLCGSCFICTQINGCGIPKHNRLFFWSLAACRELGHRHASRRTRMRPSASYWSNQPIDWNKNRLQHANWITFKLGEMPNENESDN